MSSYHYILLPAISKVGNLTSQPVRLYQYVNNAHVFDVIRSIQSKYNLKTFIFYVTQKLDMHRLENFFETFWTEFPIVTNIMICDNDTTKYPMSGFLSTSVLNIVFTTNDDDPIMEVAAKSLRGVRYMRTIFILYPELESFIYYAEFQSYTKFVTYVRTVFEFIWRRQFTNSLLVSIADAVFVLDPYPTFNIVDKSYVWDVDEFFTTSNKISGIDWKGYVIDTPILYDLPRVFPLTVQHIASAKSWLSGSSALFFQAFTEAVNATFIDSSAYVMDPNAFSFEYILHKIAEKSIEISIHSYTFVSGTQATASYPIGINDWCIMVPTRHRFPAYLYLPSVFSYWTWLIIIFGCFYISVTLWICTPSKSRDYSASLLQGICTILCISPTLMLQSSSLRTRYLFILLFLLGFITSQVFVCRMASYLTTPPEEQQIDTIDDIMATELKIMILGMEIDMIKALPNFTPKFLDHIEIVSKPKLNKYRDNLNTSYGYTVTTDRWTFLNKQQIFLRKPIFRLSKICSGPYYFAFPMQRDSHFDLTLKYFTMLVQQSGFMHAWEDRTFEDALRMKYVTMLKVNDEFIPLSVDFFMAIWIICGFGLTLAFVIFIVEIKWLQLKKIARRMKKLWKKLLLSL